jgi:DnaK suppressor protein
MNHEFLTKIKQVLIAEKNLLLVKTLPEVIDSDGDEVDQIQAKILLATHNHLQSRNADKLTRIESALKRIEETKYGDCEDCGEQIPEKRLLINPYCQACVDCAEQRESNVKVKK